ncbi:MAG: ABC transporter permease subunit [Candidatus Aminicenantes bacterium]|nr:ABC transporter permease subunit [Candidatus Aminicenantes bacterium]
MLRIVLKREILHNLYSLRFLISLALVTAVFAAGAVTSVRGYVANLEKYRETQGQFLEEMRKQSAASATELAVSRRTFTLKPRANAFIADAKEKHLPNAIVASAWNVFSFQNKSGSANPFLKKYDELSWAFITALIVSFIALLFTFDGVSGEKESKTLALSLANPVSRATLLLGKLASAVLSVMAIVLAGALTSLIIVLVLGPAGVSPALAGEVLGFLAVAALLAATFATFGLLSSVVAPSSNVSLLLALSFWLAFAVVVPNSSLFVAKKFFPITNSETVQKNVNAAFDDLNKNAPPGSWAMNSGNPFLPQHELRANLQTKRLQAERSIRDAHTQAMFRQFEMTRMVTALSPVSLFDYLTEAVAGGGYLRFRKAWDDMHIYQGQFLNFFKALDAADKDSPHWYNPFENISTTRKPVAFEKVPQFEEKPMSAAARVAPVLKYLVINVFTACAVFFLTYLLFVRYDVR